MREVLEENGVYGIAHGRELPEGFSGRQRKRAPGILFAVTRPNGETAYSFRPDAVDPENPGHKYEQPCKALGGAGNVLAVPAGYRHLIHDTDVPLVLVEGVKKMLSVVSAARKAGAVVLVVAIFGVWNWLADKRPIPDMLEIPVEGRWVGIGFDSDVFTNPDVTDAARRLEEHLTERGALVYLSHLRHGTDGSKTGADDFLAAGRTYGDYMDTFKPYDADELQRLRITRSAGLRAALMDLERRFWDVAWSGMGGHTDRDIFLVLIERARESGKVVPDGVRVRMTWGELILKVGVSRPTINKALKRLEGEDGAGLLYRVRDEKKTGKAGAFVLRASVYQYGEKGAETGGLTPNGKHPRAPRLRWSSPGSRPKLGLVEDTRRVRDSKPLKPRPPVKRLGKIRGALIDALDVHGPRTLEELAAILHRKRPRDLARRKNPETGKGQDGLLIVLEEAGIITIEGGTVSLTANWREALEDQRRLGREVDTVDVSGRLEAGAETLARRELESNKAEYLRFVDRATRARAREVKAESRRKRAAGLAAIEERRAAAERTAEQHRAASFVREKLAALPNNRIRLALLQDIWRDEGGDPWAIPKALEALGCRVEALEEYGGRKFVYPPAETGAA